MFICSKYLTYVHCDGQTCKENWRVRHLWRLELESRFKGNQGAICKVFSLQKFINFSTKFFSGVGRKNVFWTMKLSSNNFWKQLNESDVKTHSDLFRWKKSTKNGPLLPTYISIYVSTYLPPLPTYLPMMDPTLFPNSGFKKTIFNLFCSDQFRIRTPYAKKLALE